jgi:catechol 2,3-dioxygenase-like lactoylglutathione lyase family enzyme
MFHIYQIITKFLKMKKIGLYFVISVISVCMSEIAAQGEFASSTIGIGVVVSDLEKSIDFYTNVIGMQVVDEFDVDETFGMSSGLSGGIPFTVKVLKLEDSPEATQWKLMSFDKKAAHTMPKHIQDDTGAQYITIMVNNLKPFLERIEKHKVKLLGESPVVLGPDQQFALVQDPDGTFIELIGPLN